MSNLLLRVRIVLKSYNPIKSNTDLKKGLKNFVSIFLWYGRKILCFLHTNRLRLTFVFFIYNNGFLSSFAVSLLISLVRSFQSVDGADMNLDGKQIRIH